MHLIRVHKNIIIIGDSLKDPSDLDMLHRRPQHASLENPSETDMPHWRPTCLIREQHTCLIGDTLKTHMPSQRLTRDRHAWLDSDWTPQACWSSMGLHKHDDLRWGMSVSDGVCRSPMECVGFQWSMSISNESPIRHVGLRWGRSVSDV